MSDSYSDDDRGFLEDQCKRSIRATVRFSKELPHLQQLVEYLKKNNATTQQRCNILNGAGIINLVSDMSCRPKSPMMSDPTWGSELNVWCSALKIMWQLLPESYMELQMFVDNFAEKFLNEDIARIPAETLNVIKEMAENRDPFLAAAAKTILKRYSSHCSFAEASTVEIVRRMNGIFKPGQPERNHSDSSFDNRKVCSSPICHNIEEGATPFKCCGRCKKAYYCSEKCHKEDWKRHKLECHQQPST